MKATPAQEFHVGEVIARGRVGEVRRCGCGQFHVTAGPATLNFSEDAFYAFTTTLAEAAVNAKRCDAEHPSSATRLFGVPPPPAIDS